MGGLRGMEWVVILGVVLAGPALLTLVVVLAVAAGRRRTTAPSDATEAARRHGGWVHLGAWAATLLVPWVAVVALPAAAAGLQGGGYMALLAGALLACHVLAYLGVHALGERTWPRPTGPVRRAALAPRRSPAPRWLVGLTSGWAAATLVTLLVTALTATDGRHLAHGSRLAYDYPGWPFGLALLVGVTVVGLATWATLRLIARRPAVTGDDAFDAGSRRLTAHRVLRGVQLALALSLTAVLAYTSAALSDVGLNAAGVVLRAAATLAGLAGLVVAVLPARGATPESWAPTVGAGQGQAPVGTP